MGERQGQSWRDDLKVKGPAALAVAGLHLSRWMIPASFATSNYWLWGPAQESGTVIIIGGDRQGIARVFERVDEVGRTRCGYCMPYENDRPIWIGRGSKIPLSRLWPGERLYI